MTPYQEMEKSREDIKSKLKSIKMPENKETNVCFLIGNDLKVSGTTVRNYLRGNIKDGFLATAIYKQFQKLKPIK
jgi:hypothetical protein